MQTKPINRILMSRKTGGFSDLIMEKELGFRNMQEKLIKEAS